jgi:hypothetical protein
LEKSNPCKATEQAILLENLVQEGHKVKKQNVLPGTKYF